MDEARFGTHSKIGHGWFPTGERSRVNVKLGFKNFYVYSAIEPETGEVFSLIFPKVNAECMSLFLKEMAEKYPLDQIALVMDGAGWHRAKKLLVPGNIKTIYLPPYSPELNPVERFWLQVKRATIKNKVYDSLESLEDAVCAFLNTIPIAAVAQICAINWFN